jgi:hypothetical protein
MSIYHSIFPIIHEQTIWLAAYLGAFFGCIQNSVGNLLSSLSLSNHSSVEACLKKHKYNLMQGLFIKSKLDGQKFCWKEVRVLQTGRKHHLQEIQEIRLYISGSWSNQWSWFGYFSQLDFHHWSESQKITIPSSSDHLGKLRFYVGTIHMPHLSTGFIFCEVLFGI